MNEESKQAAVANIIEAAVRYLCRSKNLDDVATDVIVQDLMPRLAGIPMYKPTVFRAPHAVTKRQRERAVEAMQAEFVEGINNHTDLLVGFFVQRIVDLSIELQTAKRNA